MMSICMNLALFVPVWLYKFPASYEYQWLLGYIQKENFNRFAHPEFLPPTELEHRDAVRELLERQDMLKRRAKLNIPEFYVGQFNECVHTIFLCLSTKAS